MYKVEYKSYKDEQNNKILSITVNDVPFMMGFGDSVPKNRDDICGACLDAIHNHFKDPTFFLNDWIKVYDTIVCAVDDLCSLH